MGKVEQSRALGVVAIEKGAFESPLTKVANFTFYLYVNWKYEWTKRNVYEQTF